MKFYLINSSLFNLDPNGTHILSNRKFAKGFQQNNYEIIEIMNDNEIDIIENNRGNIILISDFINFEKDWDKIIEFADRFNNLFYILWNWHAYSLKKIPFKNYVYTFQEFILEPSINKFKEEYKLLKKLEKEEKFIPYRFSSYIDPLSNFRELNNIEKIYDVIYIGSNYEKDKIRLIRDNYKGFFRVGGGKNPIFGEEFEKLYRQSKICLGFMADENNNKNTITERIWEAFSFGCLVITNSKCAQLVTNGTAIYYSNSQELIEKINFYLNNEKERQKKIEEGYQIFMSYGNYKYNAKEFINNLKNKFT